MAQQGLLDELHCRVDHTGCMLCRISEIPALVGIGDEAAVGAPCAHGTPNCASERRIELHFNQRRILQAFARRAHAFASIDSDGQSRAREAPAQHRAARYKIGASRRLEIPQGAIRGISAAPGGSENCNCARVMPPASGVCHML